MSLAVHTAALTHTAIPDLSGSSSVKGGKQLGLLAASTRREPGMSVPFDSWNAVKRARNGIGRSLQSLELFEQLTVYENLLAGSESRGHLASVRDVIYPPRGTLSASAIAATRRFGLDIRFDLIPVQRPAVEPARS
jgi:ABC-type branched-subunit amino acid transport system ATPase component